MSAYVQVMVDGSPITINGATWFACDFGRLASGLRRWRRGSAHRSRAANWTPRRRNITCKAEGVDPLQLAFEAVEYKKHPCDHQWVLEQGRRISFNLLHKGQIIGPNIYYNVRRAKLHNTSSGGRSPLKSYCRTLSENPLPLDFKLAGVKRDK